MKKHFPHKHPKLLQSIDCKHYLILCFKVLRQVKFFCMFKVHFTATATLNAVIISATFVRVAVATD